MKLAADYHTHTCYSHGLGDIRANIEAGINRGLEEIAIADHGPASWNIRQFGVANPKTLLEIKRKVKKYDRLYPEIKVLAAVEANIIDCSGQVDVPKKILQQLDKVLVGFHRFIWPGSWRATKQIIIDNFLLEPYGICRRKIRARNTELLIKAINRYNVDVITHPGDQVNIATRKLARAAGRQNTALEINARHADQLIDFGAAAKEAGVKFCLSSDAHRPEEVGEVGPALKAAKAAGLGPEDIINVSQNFGSQKLNT